MNGPGVPAVLGPVLEEDDFSKGVKAVASSDAFVALWQCIGPFIVAMLFGGAGYELARVIPTVATLASLLGEDRYRRLALALGAHEKLLRGWPDLALEVRNGLALVDTRGPSGRGAAWWLCQVRAAIEVDRLIMAPSRLPVSPLFALGLVVGEFWREATEAELRKRQADFYSGNKPAEVRADIERAAAAALVMQINWQAPRSDRDVPEASSPESLAGLAALLREEAPAPAPGLSRIVGDDTGRRQQLNKLLMGVLELASDRSLGVSS